MLALDDTLLEGGCLFEDTAPVRLVGPLHGGRCAVPVIELRLIPLVDTLLTQIVQPGIGVLRDRLGQYHLRNFEASLICNTLRARINLWSTTHSLSLFED